MTRDESYWTARNALVDAVKAIDTTINGVSVYYAAGWDLPGAAEIRASYAAALGNLRRFDREHGGAPIL